MVKAKAPHRRLVAVSGGADSTAMALLLHERGEDFEMMFSDTGAELPEVYWLLPRLAAYVGKPLHVVSGGSFFQHLVLYGYMLPGAQKRWCTRILKQAPQNRFAESVGAEEVCIGIRADEPRRQKRWRPSAGGHEYTWPLVDAGLGKAEVRELCERHGLLNPVYEWRSSVSCFCCPFQRKGDWLGMLKHHPTIFKVAEEWEAQSIVTSKGRGQRSKFDYENAEWVPSKGTVSKKGYTWSHWALKTLREADEDQLRLWPEPSDEPCLICTA